MEKPSSFRTHWDVYAQRRQPVGEYWPGDEWGNEKSWEALFQGMFVPAGVSDWATCVEVGPGAGKYTSKVLHASRAKVIAADISKGYLEHFNARIGQEGLSARVTPLLLNRNAGTLFNALKRKGWVGTLDAFYSIDAMVHVDLQHLFVYLVTAAAALRPGGKLLLTLANCTADRGFEKLVADAKSMYARMDEPTAKFEWLSPDAAESVLGRLGFSVEVSRTTLGHSMWVVATLNEPLTDETIRACVA